MGFKDVRRRRVALGLSFGEILIAIALIGLIIVVVMGLFVKLMNASTKGLDQTVALDIAQNKLDYTGSSTPRIWMKWHSQFISAHVTQFWSSNTTSAATITGEAHSISDPRTPTLFYYTLTATELTDKGVGPDPFKSDYTNQMGDIYKLDMDVYWWPETATSKNSNATRSEFGRLSVHLDRIVFIENMKPSP